MFLAIRSHRTKLMKSDCSWGEQFLTRTLLAFASPAVWRNSMSFIIANFSEVAGAKVPEGHKVKAGHLRKRVRHREECRE
jgi:hypothetical protein